MSGMGREVGLFCYQSVELDIPLRLRRVQVSRKADCNIYKLGSSPNNLVLSFNYLGHIKRKDG